MKFKKIIDLKDPEDPLRHFQCNGIVFHNGYFYLRTLAHVHCIEPKNFKIIWSFKCSANINTYFPLFVKDNVLVYNGYVKTSVTNPDADADYIREFGTDQIEIVSVPIIGFCLDTKKELWSIDVGWAVNSHKGGIISDEHDLLIISVKNKKTFLNKIEVKSGKLNKLGAIRKISISGNTQDDNLTAVCKSGYLYFAGDDTGLNRIKLSSPLSKEENLIECSPGFLEFEKDKLYFFSKGKLSQYLISKFQPIPYALDTKTGKIDGGTPIGAPIEPNCIALINYKERLLCITSPDSDGLFCYDALTGKMLWKLGEGDWTVSSITNTSIGSVVKIFGSVQVILINPLTGEIIQSDFLDDDLKALGTIKYVNDTLFIPHSKGLGVFKL